MHNVLKSGVCSECQKSSQGKKRDGLQARNASIAATNRWEPKTREAGQDRAHNMEIMRIRSEFTCSDNLEHNAATGPEMEQPRSTRFVAAIRVQNWNATNDCQHQVRLSPQPAS